MGLEIDVKKGQLLRKYLYVSNNNKNTIFYLYKNSYIWSYGFINSVPTVYSACIVAPLYIKT